MAVFASSEEMSDCCSGKSWQVISNVKIAEGDNGMRS